MLETIARGFRQARNRLAGLTELTESNIDSALREVRLSLLEADVEIGVVKAFLSRVKEKALGKTVAAKVKTDAGTHEASASDHFIKICHDEMVAMMEFDGEPITANDELTDAVTAHAPGDQVSLTVERRGRRRSFDVTLGPR